MSSSAASASISAISSAVSVSGSGAFAGAGSAGSSLVFGITRTRWLGRARSSSVKLDSNKRYVKAVLNKRQQSAQRGTDKDWTALLRARLAVGGTLETLRRLCLSPASFFSSAGSARSPRRDNVYDETEPAPSPLRL